MGATILIVDDEQPIAHLLAQWLQESGYRVQCAYNGQQALAMACALRPDVIITDLMMPMMDGAALITAVQNEPLLQRCAIIVMSAASRHSLQQEVAAILPKPFDLEDVDRLVTQVLTEQQS